METKFVIVFLLPEHLAEKILGLRKIYQPNADLSLPPHITIIKPFYMNADWEALAEIEKFDFGVKGLLYRDVSTFIKDEKANVVYLQCTGEVLVEAQAKALQVLPALSSFHHEDSVFHLTVAKNVFGQELERLLTELQAEIFKGYFLPKHLKVFQKHKSSLVWQPLT